MAAIARQLGRPTSTESREVKANRGRDAYRLWPAHERARQNTKRLKSSKLGSGALSAKVTLWLQWLWSPKEIANPLRGDFSEDPTM